MNIKKRILPVLVFTVVLLAVMTVGVSADSSIDLNKKGSFSAGLNIPGVEVRLYNVGSISEDGSIKCKPEYEKYSVSLDEAGTADGLGAAQALEAYFIRDGVAPLAKQKSGRDGMVHFTDLVPGAYLVSCDSVAGEGESAVFPPMIMRLPSWIDEGWKYDLSAEMKHHSREGQEYCTVYKAWEMRGNGGEHPEEVIVQLLCDGRVYDEQILNAGNSWRYAWNDLDADHAWTVIEKSVPEGYNVELRNDGNVFIVRNVSEESDEPVVPEGPEKDENLPQTGQLWWPVLMMLVCGMLLITAGVYLRRTDYED